MTSSAAKTIVFIDASVTGFDRQLAALPPGVEVVWLLPGKDGIAQIGQALSSRTGLDSIQIISHGSAGSLSLGSTTLTANTIDAYADALDQWRSALSPQADILLYGCDLAATPAGQQLLDQLSQFTQADVAASTDLTGAGGNWNLEWQTGSIEAASAIDPAVLSGYAGSLSNIAVNDFNGLVSAINQANSSPGDDVITLTADINITGDGRNALPAIASNLTIEGSGRTIDGADVYSLFVVTGGNVRFNNLTIANGRAQGAAGNATTPNGGAGNGGGLRIDNGAVTLVNVAFSSNQALGGQGINNLAGAGGAGGAGNGGAIFINQGSLRLSNVVFRDNSASGGEGGQGASNAQNGAIGAGKGGAIFINSGATVIAEGSPIFTNNSATTPGNTPTDNPNQVGQFTVLVPPLSSAISRVQPSPTAAPTLSYTVTFSQDVTGVDISDFSLSLTGNLVNAAVSSVTGSGRTYTVAVNSGTGNGTLGLNLIDNDTIVNGAAVPLGGTGIGNGNLATNQTQLYTIDKNPPTVVGVTRRNPSPTAANSVTFAVQFSDPVTGVDAADFAIAAGRSLTGVSIQSVTPAADGRTYSVVVNTGTGSDTLGLNVIDNDTIVKTTTRVPLGGVGAGNGNFTTGETYSVNRVPPLVSSIERGNPNPTNAASVSFTVNFSQNVTGVDGSDFRLVPTGLSNAQITEVRPVDGNTFTVLTNTGSGDGSLGLNLVDNDTIVNELNVPLGGLGAGNANFTGQVYSVLKSSPIVSSVVPASANPTAASTVSYTVTFSQAVTGIDLSDFSLSPAGITNASLLAVAGSGNTYSVSVNTGTGSGTLGLNVVDNDTIVNAVNAPLGGAGLGNGGFIGQAYTIDKTPPRVASINRINSSPSNREQLLYSVIFNEDVNRVDGTDFALATQGVRGARILSVTRTNSSFYTVAVDSGEGNGTIGLNLIDNDSIVNNRGLVLGGAGGGNGNFTGQVYNVDKTAPTVRIVPVVPDPRRAAVNGLTIQFSEPIVGFNLADLRLTRGNENVPLRGAALSSSDGITWTLGNLRNLTNLRGNYQVSLNSSGAGIADTAENALVTNAIERWFNQITVDVCLPGIVRRGTSRGDTLIGTPDSDTLRGLSGNDVILGRDCNDTLIGDDGNDRISGEAGNDALTGAQGDDLLNGSTGQDTLLGGVGADRFIFAGPTLAAALTTSLVTAPDRVRDFRFAQGDRFTIDSDNSGRTRSLPRGLFNAGSVAATTLQGAAQAAYRDKNQQQAGNQRLNANEAVFFNWRGITYLSVNDNAIGFALSRDLVAETPTLGFRSGDATAGVLAVSNYFV